MVTIESTPEMAAQVYETMAAESRGGPAPARAGR